MNCVKNKAAIICLLFVACLIFNACKLVNGTDKSDAVNSNIMNEKPDEKWFSDQRNSMVDLIASYPSSHSVTDENILYAMKQVPRHKFVAENMQSNAYDDTPLPIGYGQTISQPFIVAYMTQMLDLKKTDRVLEIGTGSGYQAAVLSQVVPKGHIYTIEIIEELADAAKKLLSDLGYKNITVRHGDGYKGWKEFSPFDAVIVTCAPNDIPRALVDQLKIGGRMAIPVGGKIKGIWGAQELFLLKKTEKGMEQKKHFDVRFVPMVEEK